MYSVHRQVCQWNTEVEIRKGRKRVVGDLSRELARHEGRKRGHCIGGAGPNRKTR